MHYGNLIDDTDKLNLSRGFDHGNYANAYETEDYEQALEDPRIENAPPLFLTGMLLGFFSSYEIHEVPNEYQEDLIAARQEFGDPDEQ